MSGDEQAAEMEERLEARLLERVLQKVHEQLANQQPRPSSELVKEGQCRCGSGECTGVGPGR